MLTPIHSAGNTLCWHIHLSVVFTSVLFEPFEKFIYLAIIIIYLLLDYLFINE